MMAFSILVIIFGVFLSVSYGYEEIVPPDPDRPGQCFYEGKELMKGKNQLPNICEDLYCSEDGTVIVEGCSKFVINECRLGDLVDISQPFPICCKRFFHCPMDDATENIIQYSPYDE